MIDDKGIGGPEAASTPRKRERAPSRQPLTDLGLRFLSGVVLAFTTLLMNGLGRFWFAGLIVLIGLLISWEWSRIVRGPRIDAGLVAGVLAAGVGAILSSLDHAVLALLAMGIGTLVVGVLCFRNHALLSALGCLYVGIPTISLVRLRADADYGLQAVLFVLVIVWTLDTAAYFVGRVVGGPKLAPFISPNKTWSGFLGGIIAAGIAGLAFSAWVSGATPWHLGLEGVVLAIVAQGGDLAESALKRHFNVKDASALIPGHGGFMDRLDGTVAAATIAALIGHLINYAAPARALLLGG